MWGVTRQVEMIALTLLRLTQFRFEASDGNAWCCTTAVAWTEHLASILDLRRLCSEALPRGFVWKLVATWDNLKKDPQTKFRCGRATA